MLQDKPNLKAEQQVHQINAACIYKCGRPTARAFSRWLMSRNEKLIGNFCDSTRHPKNVSICPCTQGTNYAVLEAEYLPTIPEQLLRAAAVWVEVA
jgi:hypothetical protein